MCPELFHPWNACQLVEEAGFLCKNLPANVLHEGDAPADVRTKLFEFACRSKALFCVSTAYAEFCVIA